MMEMSSYILSITTAVSFAARPGSFGPKLSLQGRTRCFEAWEMAKPSVYSCVPAAGQCARPVETGLPACPSMRLLSNRHRACTPARSDEDSFQPGTPGHLLVRVRDGPDSLVED